MAWLGHSGGGTAQGRPAGEGWEGARAVAAEGRGICLAAQMWLGRRSPGGCRESAILCPPLPSCWESQGGKAACTHPLAIKTTGSPGAPPRSPPVPATLQLTHIPSLSACRVKMVPAARFHAHLLTQSSRPLPTGDRKAGAAQVTGVGISGHLGLLPPPVQAIGVALGTGEARRLSCGSPGLPGRAGSRLPGVLGFHKSETDSAGSPPPPGERGEAPAGQQPIRHFLLPTLS